MNKPTALIYGPIDTKSGYGANARDKAKAIIELKGDEWNIQIISCDWGNTPRGFINENPEWEFLNQYIITPPIHSQPDYMFWITIPSEAQPIGKWNCLITAGIETTIASAEWVQGCERMDLVIGSSKHTIDVLRGSKFEQVDPNTNLKQGEISWSKKGEVLFEGIDTNIFKPLDINQIKESNSPIIESLNHSIKEDFCFLFTGLWGVGEFSHDRKNIGLTIKAFLEVFKNHKNPPALVLKTSTIGTSYKDRNELLRRIETIRNTVKSNSLPNVYLFHGEISDSEMNELYNHPKIKSMISFNKGEGFGRPLLEFSLTNKPIICSGWSGPLDYLNTEFTTLIPGELEPVHPSTANNMLLKEALWFSPNQGHIGNSLKDMFENYKKYKELGKRQGYYSRTNFSFDKMKEKLDIILKENTPDFPKFVPLSLPKLNLPKLETNKST